MTADKKEPEAVTAQRIFGWAVTKDNPTLSEAAQAFSCSPKKIEELVNGGGVHSPVGSTWG